MAFLPCLPSGLRRRITVTILATLSILLLLYTHNFAPSTYQQTLTPANATLGFGTILAVSCPHSQRVPGLLWAANLTDLSIEIPPQPEWTGADLRSFRLDTNSTISEGSAKAWLGHLNALRYSLDSRRETALVTEDDIDFDITIRHHQIPLLAAHIRKLLSAPHTMLGKESYWGDPTTWNILYPGHCDDALPSPANPLLTHSHTLYTDTTVLPHMLLHPDTDNFLRACRVPEATRFVHRTFAPFCTFTYAVTRASASIIVRDLDRDREGVGAFDVQLLRVCGEGWRCWSVSPELFHHGDGESEIMSVDYESAGVGDKGQLVLGKGTWNVRCGARHGQLWIGEGDVEGRKEAKAMAGDMLSRGEVRSILSELKGAGEVVSGVNVVHSRRAA